MSKIMTFSRTFPAYHPKAGQPTYFVEKILRGIHTLDDHVKPIINFDVCSTCAPKHHTIRAGNRWKVGDKFSPRVWSGKPYCSPMITIAPDIEVKKVYPIEMYIVASTGYTQIYIYGVKDSSKHKVKYINGEIKKV